MSNNELNKKVDVELESDVLLRVNHLCQYFKMGQSELKAVDDVSFDIKKGEVFGLVGESGGGKTTAGRSIIKLYNIPPETLSSRASEYARELAAIGTPSRRRELK